MAAVLESVTVPRATGFRSSPRKIGTSVSALSSSSGKAACLPEFRGLKIQLQPPSRMSASSVSSRNAKVMSTRRGGIVCETKETAVEVPIVTDKTWKSLVLESNIPVLVDFWAPWCGPCRMIQPIIGELSQQYAGKLMCYKLNTDESPSIATEYGIRSIPTVIIFKNGEKKDAIIGAVPKSTLSTSIEKLL